MWYPWGEHERVGILAQQGSGTWVIGVGPNTKSRERASRLAIVIAFDLQFQDIHDPHKQKLVDHINPYYDEIKNTREPESVVVPLTDDLAPTWT